MNRMQIEEGEETELILNGSVLHLPAKRISALPVETAGIPCGLPGLQGVFLPALGKVSKLKIDGGAP